MSFLKNLSPRQQLWLRWLVVTALWITFVLYPQSTGYTRSAGIGLFLLSWGCLIMLAWRYKFIRLVLLATTILGAGFLALPARTRPDVETLRDNYAASLRRYVGVKYVWGGESSQGIDCSGLIRRGMIDASFLRGVRSLDSGLVRYSFWLWWHDCSAKALGEGYRGLTVHVLDTPSINVLDDPRLARGDLAVTDNGVHVMAYLGDHQWIEADPGEERVITLRAPSSENGWLSGRMTIVRWAVLQP